MGVFFSDSKFLQRFSDKREVGIKKFIRVNEKIRALSMRVIGPQGEQLGIVSKNKALELANQYELDLVEVAPQATPPVCRIMDFAKYKYEQEKKERQSKKHQTILKIKEIRVKPKIGEHDYQVKLKQLHTFLERGNKVKVNLFYRGREITHQEIGQRIVERFIKETQEKGVGVVEKPPVREGKVVSTVFAPHAAAPTHKEQPQPQEETTETLNKS